MPWRISDGKDHDSPKILDHLVHASDCAKRGGSVRGKGEGRLGEADCEAQMAWEDCPFVEDDEDDGDCGDE